MDLQTKFQKSGRAKNGNLTFTTAATTSTIITALSANHTIFVQRIIVSITTDAAQSLTFKDTAGTPVTIAVVPTSPGAPTRWDFDFGPKGVPLTLGKNLTATFSGAGLAGHMEWTAYETPQTLT